MVRAAGTAVVHRASHSHTRKRNCCTNSVFCLALYGSCGFCVPRPTSADSCCFSLFKPTHRSKIISTDINEDALIKTIRELCDFGVEKRAQNEKVTQLCTIVNMGNAGVDRALLRKLRELIDQDDTPLGVVCHVWNKSK